MSASIWESAGQKASGAVNEHLRSFTVPGKSSCYGTLYSNLIGSAGLLSAAQLLE